MSDEFDSLDATEKAAVEGALNNAKRPSDHVVQTAPVTCRYTESGICVNIAGCTKLFSIPQTQAEDSISVGFVYLCGDAKTVDERNLRDSTGAC